MRGWIVAVLLFVTVLAVEQSAQACSCLPPDEGRSYNDAEHVVHVRVVSAVRASRTSRLYLARLVEPDFKGCLGRGRWVLLRTAADSAMCGIDLARGEEYLLHGTTAGHLFGTPILGVGLCDSNARWGDVTPEQHAFLGSRFVCCGDECACTDGSQPVNCFVDPCQVSSCDVEGATCTANYCGGCNAEWSDESGARVCEAGSDAGDGCTRDEPHRSYIANDPEACSTIRFACADGLRPFFDECGCGCEQGCVPSGCSGQVCADVDSNIVTTCEWRDEYACYRDAECTQQADGSCGWTPTAELEACLADPPPPT
jgi:hypothetical protein